VIFVDKLRKHPNGWWCHMISDQSDVELHDMARRIGLRREWFQNVGTPHYDLRPSKREQALKAGAQEISDRELVTMMQTVRRGS
jgi:hypothetical protein